MIIDELVTTRTQGSVDRAIYLCDTGWENLSEEERIELKESYLILEDITQKLTDSLDRGLYSFEPVSGIYRPDDLNRVGEAITYISNRLANLQTTINDYADSKHVGYSAYWKVPYDVTKFIGIVGKTDWAVEDFSEEDAIAEYLAQVTYIATNSFPSLQHILPSTLKKMSFQSANDIEEVFKRIDVEIDRWLEEKKTRIDLIASNFQFYSGEIYGGEI